jgi:hypothetical protein
MKKVLLLPFLIIALNSVAQMVNKGSFLRDAGTGFGLYQATDNDDSTGNSLVLPGLLNLYGEYQLTGRWGFGLLLERNGYLSDRDSSDRAHSFHAGISTAFRILNIKRTVVYAGALYGISSFSYKDLSNNRGVNSLGSNFQLLMGMRQYFSDHLGFFVHTCFTTAAYNELADEDGNILKTGDGSNKIYRIRFSGANLRIGFSYKF